MCLGFLFYKNKWKVIKILEFSNLVLGCPCYTWYSYDALHSYVEEEKATIFSYYDDTME